MLNFYNELHIFVRNNKITRVRVLYGMFGGILLICLGLFVSHIFLTEEMPKVGMLTSMKSDYAFTITDLRSAPRLYEVEHNLANLPEGVSAHAHVNRFDVDVYTDDKELGTDPRLTWTVVLQMFVILASAAVLVLVVIALVSFYRSAKRGQVFPKRNVWLLMVIGILLVAMSLSIDTGSYLERRMAYNLLKGTEWVPQARYTLHFTRIFFGLTLIFLSQIIRIGRELQEEQELTI